MHLITVDNISCLVLLLSILVLDSFSNVALAFRSLQPLSFRTDIRSSNSRMMTSFMTTSTDATTAAAATIAALNLPPLSTNAKRVFWVRHGEVINPGGDKPVYYGAQDVPLSRLGELEAIAAADYLQQFPLAAVYSSPLQRAVYGAEQVARLQKKNVALPCRQLPGFTELDRGAWCGLTKAEIGPENLARFDACDESITPAGGESYPQLKQRVLEARDQVLTDLMPGQMACVVSHLQVTRSILSDALDIPTDQMAKLKVATASVTCIDYILDAVSNNEKADDEKDQVIVHFQSFKPESGLAESVDGAN